MATRELIYTQIKVKSILDLIKITLYAKKCELIYVNMLINHTCVKISKSGYRKNLVICDIILYNLLILKRVD